MIVFSGQQDAFVYVLRLPFQPIFFAVSSAARIEARLHPLTFPDAGIIMSSMTRQARARTEAVISRLCDFFPFWDKLDESQKLELTNSAVNRVIPAGVVLHNGSDDCVGLTAVQSGRLRAFIRSPEGREMTVFRLMDMDICLFSASCMLNSIRFDITIEAEQDTSVYIIPAGVYKKIMDNCAAAANFTNELMSQRFSEVMWLIEEVMWQSFDSRLAAFLLEESAIEGSDEIHLTHEKIASHLGTAREVVTRMLKYFADEGLASSGRGTVVILDRQALASRAARPRRS